MSVLASVDLDAINTQARQVNYQRSVLSVIVAVLFAIGWIPGVAAHALAWTVIAIREGYRAGRQASAHARAG